MGSGLIGPRDPIGELDAEKSVDRHGLGSPAQEQGLDVRGLSANDEAAFEVYVEFEGAPYPSDEVLDVKYLVFDATGDIIEVGSAEFSAEGLYTFTLSAETTALLSAGAGKIEVAVVVVPVSIPAFSTFEFVAE